MILSEFIKELMEIASQEGGQIEVVALDHETDEPYTPEMCEAGVLHPEAPSR